VLSLKPLSLGDASSEVNCALAASQRIYPHINEPHINERKNAFSRSLVSKGDPMSLNSGNGIITIPSAYTVDQTVQKLQAMLQTKGVTLFAVIDHRGEAQKVGLKMPPTKVLIFGNPKGGTPLMLAAPSIAIDLPLKILVAEGTDGKVSISYNAPEYLQERHHLPADLLPNIAVAGALAAKAAE
jgi:uncharacterized protein (DUF302 family)